MHRVLQPVHSALLFVAGSLSILSTELIATLPVAVGYLPYRANSEGLCKSDTVTVIIIDYSRGF